MLHTKISKPLIDFETYAKMALWAQDNNATIEDKGSYYEVCENVTPEPTTDEKLAALDAQYNADKAELLTAYQTAQMYGDTDTMGNRKADLAALDAQYDEDYERIVGEG